MRAAIIGLGQSRRAAVLAAWIGIACSGCASTASDTGDASLTSARNTGTYPNLNVPPPVATQPFDAASLNRHNQALDSARAGQDQQGRNAAALSAAGNAEQQRLKRLAAALQAKTIREIESGSPRSSEGALRRAQARRAEAEQDPNAPGLSAPERERRRKLAQARQAETLKGIEAPR